MYTGIIIGIAIVVLTNILVLTSISVKRRRYIFSGLSPIIIFCIVAFTGAKIVDDPMGSGMFAIGVLGWGVGVFILNILFLFYWRRREQKVTIK